MFVLSSILCCFKEENLKITERLISISFNTITYYKNVLFLPFKHPLLQKLYGIKELIMLYL